MRKLELLAPAKDLSAGIAAIEHGADAVYIGASQFGARVAAGNSVAQIAALADYAHQFGARVYVTVNTIVYDNELQQADKLIHELKEAGVDAILVQDMAVAKMALDEGLEIHASTQTDNRTAEKVRWLAGQGFTRVVLARELSLGEIAAICKSEPATEVEVFVHGALCTSYSGQCYASWHCFNRSANRGECAQFCRMKFDLVDAEGRVLAKQKHLLSLKDMCRIEHLEALADAGVTSFKIEGRLKDEYYIKNVVAAYSRKLDEIISTNPQKYYRASNGKASYHFEPALNKTFNRGFTTYFLQGNRHSIASFHTPKAIGELVGRVKTVQRNYLVVAGTATFSNGDGLCFFDEKNELQGFRVNKVEGNKLFPHVMPVALMPGMSIYRNHDAAFERLLSQSSAMRKIPIEMEFVMQERGFLLSITLRNMQNGTVQYDFPMDYPHQEAKSLQRDNIIKQLSKLGDTPFTCDKIDVDVAASQCFVPSSILSAFRRNVMNELKEKCKSAAKESRTQQRKIVNTMWEDTSYFYKEYPYLYNIANSVAQKIYKEHGLGDVSPAYELLADKPETALLMQCKHCIRYEMGLCARENKGNAMWKEPLYLQLSDGKRFRLEFLCAQCQMNVYAE